MRAETMPQSLSDDARTALVVELYEAYYRPLFAYVYQLIGDAEWAHDLVQETFLRLYRERAKLDAVENRRAWVYRIASNVTFTGLRRQRRFRWLPWRKVEETTQVAPDPTAAAGERQMAVERALAALPAHYRAPLLLYSYFGLSVREVAAALALSETAVTTRLYRARKMFREAYGEGSGQDND